MLGKQKCKILKEIRQRIADENDIPYVTHECRYQGECSGTCPRCESELRYLEQQLSLRASMGKRVAVTALCAGMALSTAGCGSAVKVPTLTDDLGGAVPYVEETGKQTGPEIEVLEGEVAWPESYGTDFSGSDALPEEPEDLSGTDALPAEDSDPEPVEIVLMGDVAYFPDEAVNG